MTRRERTNLEIVHRQRGSNSIHGERAHSYQKYAPLSKKNIEENLMHGGTMNKDVHKYIRECTCRRDKNPIVLNAITLYKMPPIAPKWTGAMVKYMTTNVMPKR